MPTNNITTERLQQHRVGRFDGVMQLYRRSLDSVGTDVYFIPHGSLSLAISQLRPSKPTVEEHTDCSICLCDTKPCHIKLPCCQQQIHPWCLVSLIHRRRYNCPLCRKSLDNMISRLPLHNCLLWWLFKDLEQALQSAETMYTLMNTLTDQSPRFTTQYIKRYCALQCVAVDNVLVMLGDRLNCDLLNLFAERLDQLQFYRFACKHARPEMDLMYNSWMHRAARD
jgi:hypothetical protein